MIEEIGLSPGRRVNELDDTTLAKLAREMVINIRPYQSIFEDFGIDETDYYRIEKIDYYKKIKEHFTQEWNSTLSTEDRIKLESLATFEQMMVVLARRAMRDDTPLPAAVEVGKLLAKTAGIGEGKAEKNFAERFVITINLGSDVEHYDKSITIDANDISPGPVDKMTSQQIETLYGKINGEDKTVASGK
jgi:hypothetical protein